MIHIADYPQLRAITWSTPLLQDMGDERAFRTYEKNWGFVSTTELSAKEIALIDRLAMMFGNGYFMPTEGRRIELPRATFA